MKERTKGVLTGVLATCLILGATTTALAATGAVTFNRSPIQFNGEQISAAGEDYALDNGCMAPSSITYTDEKGGGTTYLPARRIAELMGVGIGWDAATGAVTVSGEATPAPTTTAPNTTTPAPDTTASVANYSDWTAEEEAAYQEFKGMWEVIKTDKGDVKYGAAANVIGGPWESYTLNTTSSMAQGDLVDFILAVGKTGFTTRLAKELSSSNVSIEIYFYKDGWYITGFLQEAN